MAITITLIIGSLVALNFLLLVFSCQPVERQIQNKSEVSIEKQPKLISNQLESGQLAPTGS